MKMLMILGIMLGVAALLVSQHDFSPSKGQADTIAVNYAVYRNAAFLYAEKNKSHSGNIAIGALKLPSSWKPLRDWQARMNASHCYVFGMASDEEIEAAREVFCGSFAVGRAQAGRIVPQPGNAVSVPAFVPEGSLISVIEVK